MAKDTRASKAGKESAERTPVLLQWKDKELADDLAGLMMQSNDRKTEIVRRVKDDDGDTKMGGE